MAALPNQTNLNQTIPFFAPLGGGGGGGVSQFQTLFDAKPSGSNAGFLPTVSNYFTRELNNAIPSLVSGKSIVLNDMTLSGNQITLGDGTYTVTASTPGCRVGRHRCRIYNLTTSNVELIGQNAFANDSDFDQTASSILNGTIVVSGGPNVYELQQIAQLTNGDYDLGLSCSFGDDEIYAMVSIQQIA